MLPENVKTDYLWILSMMCNQTLCVCVCVCVGGGGVNYYFN